MEINIIVKKSIAIRGESNTLSTSPIVKNPTNEDKNITFNKINSDSQTIDSTNKIAKWLLGIVNMYALSNLSV